MLSFSEDFARFLALRSATLTGTVVPRATLFPLRWQEPLQRRGWQSATVSVCVKRDIFRNNSEEDAIAEWRTGNLQSGVSGAGLLQSSRLVAREINIPAPDISSDQFYS